VKKSTASQQGTRNTMLKSTFSGLQYGSIFIHCLKSAKSREILRKFELIAVQGHPRPWILVQMEST